MASQINANVPDKSITKKEVSDAADLQPEMMLHLHNLNTDFGVDFDVAPSADVKVIIFRATGAGTITRVEAVMADTGTTDTDVKFDLLKAAAGAESTVSVLSSTIDFVFGDTDNTAKSGTISSASFVAGDVFIAHMDFVAQTASNGPGMFVQVTQDKN